MFFQDLPLSIQDGYERFLSSSSVSLLQYQVQVEAEAMMMEECAAKRTTTKYATGFFFFFFFYHKGVRASEETGLRGAQI